MTLASFGLNGLLVAQIWQTGVDPSAISIWARWGSLVHIRYLGCSKGSKFPRSNAPRILGSQGSGFPRSYVPRILCSLGPTFPQPHILRALCSQVFHYQGTFFSNGPTFHGFCAPRVTIAKLLFPKVLCSLVRYSVDTNEIYSWVRHPIPGNVGPFVMFLFLGSHVP